MRTSSDLAFALFLLGAACGGRERPSSGGDAAGSGSPADVPASRSAEARAPVATRSPIRDPVQVKVNADVDGSRGTYSGLGECQYTSEASIFQVPAALWRASVEAETGQLRSVNLTLWQPKGSDEMQVSLTLANTGGTYSIATVKGAELKGSGNGRVEPSGAGGTIRVEGKDADGHSIRVVLECARWTEPVAEGG
ncbi:MAG TPA: hypothetical protein VMY76_13940 [Gemmatimonadales bacterium]|nr:hypothetical protein [Gemmatimonadales bacterium]